MQAMTPYRVDGPAIPAFLTSTNQLGVVQRKELMELFGFETRNKYSVHLPDGREIAYCAEQGKSFIDAMMRQFVGHWRSFSLHVFDSARQPLLVAEHPFRWFFQRLEVKDAAGRPIGAIARRWSLFHKSFDVVDPHDRVLLSVTSPFWRIWTFRFMRDGRELATVEKKWSGFLTEVFTDADRFGVTFDPSLPPPERALVLLAAVYIDLLYFEKKQSGGITNLLGD